MFEQASRLKLRFNTSRGDISTEDLWDLPLTSTVNKPNLDDIARGLDSQIKQQEGGSFVNTSSNRDTTLDLAFDIVKHIISVRLAENEAKLNAEKDRQRKAKILERIEQKKDQQLDEMSIEELEALIK